METVELKKETKIKLHVKQNPHMTAPTGAVERSLADTGCTVQL